MRNYPVNVLNAADTSSQTGSALFVGQSVSASFVPTFGDSTAAGTIKVQGSNDIPVSDPNQFVPTNWADIPNATSTIASGVGPAIVIQSLCFQYIRVVFTRSGGGSSTVSVNATLLGV